jgi:hypothetical protein
MQDTLYEYLILHKQLSLPGVGTLYLQQHPSQLDFGNKQITAQTYSFKLDSTTDKPSKRLIEWLSNANGISEWDAVKSINDFAFDLKKSVSSAGEMSWNNIGIFRRNDKGNFSLVTEAIKLINESPVKAEKVIREKAFHQVLVGENEKTSVEMEAFFTETKTSRDTSWLIALILTVLAIVFAGWYFSEKGLNPAATGNQSILNSK